MGLPGRLRLEVDGGPRLRPAQTHERVRIKHSTVAVDDATIMPVGRVFTVIGDHDRRLSSPSGILRRDMGTAPCIGCGTYAFVFFLVHAAGTNEWLAVPHKMLTTRRFKQL